MAMNGIGPLVRQWVHERNDARRAERTGEGATPPAAPAPTSEIDETSADSATTAASATVTTTSAKSSKFDTATFTPEALARFEAWKTRHGVATPITTPVPITTPIVTADPVDPIFIPAPGTTNGEPA